MKLATFIADSPASALAQIQEQLGPEAVVLSVRPVPASGLARLWQKQRAVEVLAGVEEPEPNRAGGAAPQPTIEPGIQPADSVAPGVREQSREVPPAARHDPRLSPFPLDEPSLSARDSSLAVAAAGHWRAIGRLETMGLLPVFADRLQERVCARHGHASPATAEAEWQAVRGAFLESWRPAPPLSGQESRPHVFIGPPGVGKTTLLCKWLAKSMLLEERAARVWRLDGASANTAELLNVYGEMFGLTVERFWQAGAPTADLLLVDLPGVETSDPMALAALKEQLAMLPSPRVHLVLNGAYDVPILFTQFRAFAGLKPEDLSITHLDEEERVVKLWNFVLGTGCPLRFLSAGQKIPGDFLPAEPSLLLPGNQSSEKSEVFAKYQVRQGAGKGSA